MEKYKIGIQAKGKHGSKSFYIKVSVEPQNLQGGFKQWIGNSRHKDAVSEWLAPLSTWTAFAASRPIPCRS